MRLMAMVVAALVLLGLSISQMNAAFRSGNDLYEACTSQDRSYCLGYVSGVSDTLSNDQLHLICPPEGILLRQTVDVVVKYLHDHISA